MLVFLPNDVHGIWRWTSEVIEVFFVMLYLMCFSRMTTIIYYLLVSHNLELRSFLDVIRYEEKTVRSW